MGFIFLVSAPTSHAGDPGSRPEGSDSVTYTVFYLMMDFTVTEDFLPVVSIFDLCALLGLDPEIMSVVNIREKELNSLFYNIDSEILVVHVVRCGGRGAAPNVSLLLLLIVFKSL